MFERNTSTMLAYLDYQTSFKLREKMVLLVKFGRFAAGTIKIIHQAIL